MNKIVIEKNILADYKDQAIEIRTNKIIFKGNGDYTLEYVDSDFVDLDIEILDDVTVKLFIWGCDNDIQIKNRYQVGRNSNLILFKFYYNRRVFEEIEVNLNGEYSKFNYNFSSISREKEEYHIIVNHNNHKVSSNVSNKCIGINDSKISLKIDSVLAKGNVDCVMDQTSRILTLGDVAATIIPNMFIEEDSVEARHGSVIGKIRPEEIFYLTSRGITEAEAITLLIKGFIFSNLVVDMEQRAKIFKVIQDLRR